MSTHSLFRINRLMPAALLVALVASLATSLALLGRAHALPVLQPRVRNEPTAALPARSLAQGSRHPCPWSLPEQDGEEDRALRARREGDERHR